MKQKAWKELHILLLWAIATGILKSLYSLSLDALYMGTTIMIAALYLEVVITPSDDKTNL